MVIEDEDVANCHVHTSDPGMMLSEAIKYGYLTDFKIENMHEQFLARQKQGRAWKSRRRPRAIPPVKSLSTLPWTRNVNTALWPWLPVKACALSSVTWVWMPLCPAARP